MKIQLHRLILLGMIIFSMLLSSSVTQASIVSPSTASSLSGWFITIWEDDIDGLAESQQFYLNTGDGNYINLILSEELIHQLGGVLVLDRKPVTVEGSWVITSGDVNNPLTFQVKSIPLPDEAVSTFDISHALSGSQPWISIMCKFSDVGTEPKNLAYFQGMYSSSWPGLDHYWRELSYDNINLIGSTAVGWYTLPQPRSYYFDGDTLDWWRSAADCTGVADPYVNYAGFTGINLMFNDDLGGYWGGSYTATLDGVSKAWGMTWLSPAFYSLMAAVSHEMGHGFGLPHSSGPNGQPYGNIWDI